MSVQFLSMPIKATVYKTAIQNSYYELEAMRGSRYPQHVNIELSAILFNAQTKLTINRSGQPSDSVKSGLA